MVKLASSRTVLLLLFIFLCALVALIAVRPAHGGSPAVVAMHLAERKQPGKVTFIDPDTLAVIGSAEVKESPCALRYDAAGNVLYLFSAKQPIVTMTPTRNDWTLWTVERDGFKAARIGVAGNQPFRYLTDEAGTRLYAVSATPKAKTTPIVAFDLVGRKALGSIATVEHLTSVTLSPDGATLYAFCEGKKHKKPKGPPGNLHLLDAMTGAELARLDAGPDASSVGFDSKRGLVYVLGSNDQEGNGQLTVLRAGAIVARLTLQGRPLRFALGPDGTDYVLAANAVVALAEDGLAVARTWPVEFDPGSLAFDTEHGRLFASALSGSKIAELDLPGGNVVVEHATGSAAVKAGKAVGGVLLAIASFGTAFMTGFAMIPPTLPPSAAMTMSFGPGGAFLYVLNPFTNDVSVFDTVRHDVVGHVPTGGGAFRMVRTEGDPNLWIESRAQLLRLNTSTNLIDRKVPLYQSFHQAPVAYDLPRHRAWIAMKTKILVLDLRTGEIAGTVELPSAAFAVWVDGTRVREPDAPHP